MSSPRATLMAAGVPVGAPRARPTVLPDAGELARAVRAGGEALEESERTALAAWLAAFHHHWPSDFEATLGEEGLELLATLRSRVTDANRFLKLRRIAIENLATAI